MRWVHGGDFTVGSGAASYYDGTAFARDRVILVTLTLPSATTLFANAIVNSAPAWSLRPVLEQIEARGPRLAAAAGLAGSARADTLRRLPGERFLAAQPKRRYGPAVDGCLFIEWPEQRVAEGSATPMPIVIASKSLRHRS
jgi:carboxylesterase type B